MPVRKRVNRSACQPGNAADTMVSIDCREERGDHHFAAADAIGDHAGNEQHQSHGPGRERDHQAGLGRADVKLAREDGKQRLHAVKQCESRETCDQECQCEPAIRRSPAEMRVEAESVAIVLPIRMP